MIYYSGLNFFETLFLFFSRTLELLSGNLALEELASDEIQVYTLALTSFSASLVGTLLVLRKMTMLANALSHTILIGIVVAFLWTRLFIFDEGNNLPLTAMLLAAVGVGLLTTFLTNALTRLFSLQEDAAIGLVFTSLFALGILIVTLYTRSIHIGTEVVMGNVDALHVSDLKLAFWVCAVNGLFVLLFFKEFQITTFDPLLAKAFGISLILFDYLLMTMTSLTAISGFRAVGVLMVLAFITAPPLTARLFTRSLKGMMLLSAGVGALAALLGVALARHLLSTKDLPLSTGGLTVMILGLIFFSSLLVREFYRRPERLINR